MDPYTILEVRPGAARAEIAAAYHALAIKWHPDRHIGQPSEAEATRRMQAINAAYAALCDGTGPRRGARVQHAPPPPPPSPAPPPVADAYLLIKQGHPVRAQKALESIPSEERDAVWWRCFATCRMRLGDVPGASAAFAGAAARDSGDRFARGMAQIKNYGVPWWRRAVRAIGRR